jgi:type I restriction enzyme S subunit
MAYSRPDMDGMACTEDVLRIVPDSAVIPCGFLFAFLNSRYGIPMVTSGTYGAIIQHIEPEHVADLPVPRLGGDLEGQVHELVERAAQARSTAARLLAETQSSLSGLLGLRLSTEAHRGLSTTAKSGWLADRIDAYYYSARCVSARQAFDGATSCEPRRLHTVADLSIPGIFKRLYADDPRFGVPYITGGDVFQIAPTSDQYLQRRVAETYGLVIRRGMILVQEAGQLGGLIGRSVLVGSYLDGFAVSNNMIRIAAKEPDDIGYLYAVLSSEPGVTLIAREAAGSSIPHIEANRVRQIEIPWASRDLRVGIGGPVVQAWNLRDQACLLETEARQLVERAIEEAP